MTGRSRPGPLLRCLFRLPIHLYDCNADGLVANRFVLLFHPARRTGPTRKTVPEVVGADAAASAVTVISAFGLTRTGNRTSNKATQIVIGSHSFPPIHQDLPQNEPPAALADHEHRHRLAGPELRRVLSRLVGWRYDATEDSPLRLVRELPLGLFSPRRRWSSDPSRDSGR